jgi:hypothetical protein
MSGDDENRGIKKTLPLGQAPIIKPRETADGSANTIPATAAFAPERWDSESNLVSSAKLPTLPPSSSASGMVTLSGNRLSEDIARELINRRFARSGYSLQADYRFHHGDTLVTLDGFDPERQVGFQYISHADQDVVTDHDVSTTLALKELEAEGQTRVLIIHDGEAPTGDELIAIVDEFLGA